MTLLRAEIVIPLLSTFVLSSSGVDVKCPRKGNSHSSSHWNNTCNFVYHDPDHNVESREQSSLAVSTRYPNILYTMNDSPGGQYRISKEDLVIFRFDLTDCSGVCDHRVVALVFPRDFRVLMDLEAIDYGECEDGGGEFCIFLGNTGGNNWGSQHDHYIWKVKEPTPDQIWASSRLDSESRTWSYNIPTEDIKSLKYAYPDQDYDWFGHIDVEAMIVDPVVRQIVLIQRNNDGSPARIWTLPMDYGFSKAQRHKTSHWMTAFHEIGEGGHQVKVKQPLVTDASRSANGQVVVVRGYGSASYFYLAGRSVLQTFRDAMDHVDGWYECEDALDVKGGHNDGEGQPQGEGIALDYTGQFYYTNTEWGHYRRGKPEENEKCITTYQVLW